MPKVKVPLNAGSRLKVWSVHPGALHAAPCQPSPKESESVSVQLPGGTCVGKEGANCSARPASAVCSEEQPKAMAQPQWAGLCDPTVAQSATRSTERSL